MTNPQDPYGQQQPGQYPPQQPGQQPPYQPPPHQQPPQQPGGYPPPQQPGQYPPPPQQHGGDLPGAPPPPPGAYGQQHPQMPRPKEVDNAFLALCIAIGLWIIASLVSLFEAGGQVEQDLQGTGVDPGTVMAVGGIITLVFAVIFGALGVFFGVQMRKGRNWARITLTVIGALVILGALVQGFTNIGNAPISSILQLLQGIAAVAVIVFMWRGNAKHYFG